MDSDGTQDARGTHANPVPRPAGPPEVPSAPPRPARAPGMPPLPDGSAFLTWLRTPRPEALPGVWRFGHRPRPMEEPVQIATRELLSGALIALLVGWLIWSLLANGYLGGWWLLPLELFTPDSWRTSDDQIVNLVVWDGYTLLVVFAIMIGVGRLGRWGEVWRRFGAPRLRRPELKEPQPTPEDDPVTWPALRAAGATDAADRLAADARAGLMRDVDHARITRAWQGVRSGRHPLATFAGAVLGHGAAACPHPSGARDLPARQARHDLVTGQVRLGTTADDVRNPYAYRGTGLALGPELLGTSLVAVGPAGSGKTSAVVRPVAESLCLHALAGRAAVVVVGAAGVAAGPADAYDVVVRIGHPDSVYDLDLYGGTTDPDEAAAVLAEALVGDLADPNPGNDSRRATTVLAQLLGPFHAVHGRFPSVPELRGLLDGSPGPLAELRQGLTETGQRSLLRELDARERQMAHPGDVGGVLADRVALLDRPAFATFFKSRGFDTSGQSRPFTLKALDHPVRVRVDLPARGHADASRVLARLVLAQFTASVTEREDRSLFACLVLDDATGVITPEAVRGIQRLRSANAGAVLTLRTLDDVARPLRGPLLGTVGCRMALAGLTPWDGQDFAEVWGKEWTEARDVTDRQIIAESPAGKAWHAVRRAITGKAPTARAVTVRQVERERWSASELAHAMPAGHAVLSLTDVRGEHAPPLLVDLRD
ncbi:ATP-binding protein [Streptomyces sp. KMM 9044]|uniref:ATP-binding protein n=1 Tax=Streptomyces sp. KMM 9044 TaxID=2744474 RepID=UPI0021506C7C|nr:ATP-binding protein [Streptomyces sp. KMM 9044]WAX77675.1 ATP-binding protein [Streptomyces sp. KMM 9044]